MHQVYCPGIILYTLDVVLGLRKGWILYINILYTLGLLSTIRTVPVRCITSTSPLVALESRRHINFNTGMPVSRVDNRTIIHPWPVCIRRTIVMVITGTIVYIPAGYYNTVRI